MRSDFSGRLHAVVIPKPLYFLYVCPICMSYMSSTLNPKLPQPHNPKLNPKLLQPHNPKLNPKLPQPHNPKLNPKLPQPYKPKSLGAN